MNIVIQNLTPLDGPVGLDEYALDRARQARRIGAAFAWTRVPVFYPGDPVIPELPSTVDEVADAPEIIQAAGSVPVAAVVEARHALGSSPHLVDIRALISVRDDATSTPRHAELDPSVLAALCAGGGR